MKTFLLAILVAIVILVILTAQKTLQCSRSADANREQLTSTECGLFSAVTLPAIAPLSRYDFYENQDSPSFADIGPATSASNANLELRHAALAKECDETPGCVAFNSSGWLKAGILPADTRPTAITYGAPCSSSTHCGLFVRKCALPEPLYAELYADIDFKGQRLLVPPGRYATIGGITPASGAIGNMMLNNTVSSVIVPLGLRVTIYWGSNFGSPTLILNAGRYPRLTAYKTGRDSTETWNDEAAAIVVEYARL
jgi:hypothetical protein